MSCTSLGFQKYGVDKSILLILLSWLVSTRFRFLWGPGNHTGGGFPAVCSLPCSILVVFQLCVRCRAARCQLRFFYRIWAPVSPRKLEFCNANVVAGGKGSKVYNVVGSKSNIANLVYNILRFVLEFRCIQFTIQESSLLYYR